LLHPSLPPSLSFPLSLVLFLERVPSPSPLSFPSPSLSAPPSPSPSPSPSPTCDTANRQWTGHVSTPEHRRRVRRLLNVVNDPRFLRSLDDQVVPPFSPSFSLCCFPSSSLRLCLTQPIPLARTPTTTEAMTLLTFFCGWSGWQIREMPVTVRSMVQRLQASN